MSKPTIVLAPGAWHSPDCFDAIREQLHVRGWTTEAIAYPSAGAEPPATKGLPHDAAAVRSALERLADNGKEIILVVHSYGGIVGQNAVEGLGYKQRRAHGKSGGVIMFVYLAAFVAPKGASLEHMLGGQYPPWMRFEGDYTHAETPEVVFYHDVDAEGQKSAIAKLKHSPARIFTGEVLYEPWHEIACMYFFCETDMAIPLPLQKQMAQALGPDSVSYTTPASHSPFLSRVQDMVDGLEYAAKMGQRKKMSN